MLTSSSRRLSRLGIATISALSLTAVTLSPAAFAAPRPGYSPLGTQHTSTTVAYPADTPAMEWSLNPAYSTYYEGGFSRAYDGAHIGWGKNFTGALTYTASAYWPAAKVDGDSTKTTISYAGTVNGMQYCIAANGSHQVSARGNCQDDLTISNPTITVDFAANTIALEATVYYHNKITNSYVGPKKMLVASGGGARDTGAEYPLTLERSTANGVTTVKANNWYLSDEFANTIIPAQGSDSASLITFSYPAVAGSTEGNTDGTEALRPIRIGDAGGYKDNNATTLSYPTGGDVQPGDVKTLSPEFLDANGTVTSPPSDVTFTLDKNSDPGFSIDSSSGVVTYSASAKNQRPKTFTPQAGVIATYPDQSQSLSWVGFTFAGSGATQDSFARGGDKNDRLLKDVQDFSSNLVVDVRLINEAMGPYTTRMAWTGKGLVYANLDAVGIYEAGPQGRGPGFDFGGFDSQVKVALVPQSSKTYWATGSQLKVIAASSSSPDTVFDAGADEQITGFGIAQDYQTLGMLSRDGSGHGTFRVFSTDADPALLDGDPSVSGKKPTMEFSLPSDLFGAKASNVWGPEDPQGWGDDLLPLPDGNWLWINDLPAADGSSNMTPIVIDTKAKTAHVATGLTEQFAGTRSIDDSLHGAISGNQLVVFNQATAVKDKPAEGDPQNIGFYTYDPSTQSFKAQGPAGAINGVTGVVSVTFDEDNRPVFVDNANFLTVVDPTTRTVVKGGEPFHGMNRLNSLNRHILVRKGDWYYTMGESTDDDIAVIEGARPELGAATKATETTEADRYVPAAAVSTATAGSTATTPAVAFTTGDSSPIGAPAGVRFSRARGVDQRFTVDPRTGSVTFAVTDADKGSVTVPVAVTYADGSAENVDVTVKVASNADSDAVTVTVPKATVNNVVAGSTATLSPTIRDASGKDVSVKDAKIASFAITDKKSHITVNTSTGELTLTVPADNVTAHVESATLLVTFADGSTTAVPVEFAVTPKQSVTPAPSPQGHGDDSGSGDSGSAAIGVIAVIIALLGALAAAVGSGAVAIPGIPSTPGLPGPR